MSTIKFPSRPAPSIEEARQKNLNNNSKIKNTKEKKKAPPRPPPPDLAKVKSRSAWTLDTDNTISLIEWSPPSSPKNKSHAFAGSVSSSFSSSTSSLASSKKSYDEPVNQNTWNNNTPFPFPAYNLQGKQTQPQVKVIPTIIRAQGSKGCRASSPSEASSSRGVSPLLNSSPPMPNIPPPSPPKEISEFVSPFGIALFNYTSTQNEDLSFETNDIVYILRKVNDEWLYGRVDDREGMFPANFVDVQVPLEDEYVTALYEFRTQIEGDLEFIPGQRIKILKRISDDWLMGESQGMVGQFPSNFVDNVPPNI
ncbi:PREDICTED: SH3 domain-containing protein 19 [Nicrophorus vespilloides]|uniref:SH3 domain-containing protein 19 n=1 Tax=Nicrophorus vespilloides TaxID=110193 RepID=A0ABM1M3K2_NICVS|nr:PREDICTED: SH3 domain-containing protein 19 [Nicrophorus vespilloides]